MTAPAPAPRKSWMPLLRVAVLAALVVAALSGAEAGLQLDWHPELLWASLAGVPLTAASLLALAERWRLLVDAPGLRRGVSLRAVVLTVGLNPLLPLRGSEFLKILYVREHGGVRLRDGIAAIVVEKSLDMAVFAAVGAATLLTLRSGGNPKVLFALGAMALAAIILLPIVETPLLRVLAKLPAGAFMQAQLRAVVDRLRGRRGLAAAGTATLAAWLFSIVRVVVFLAALGTLAPGLGWEAALAVFAATTLGGTLAVLPAGFGTYEAAAVVVLKKFGIELGAALPIAVALHVSQLLPPTLAGLILASGQPLGIAGLLSSLRQMAARGADEGEGTP